METSGGKNLLIPVPGCPGCNTAAGVDSCLTHGPLGRITTGASGPGYRCGAHGPYYSRCPECVRLEEQERCAKIAEELELPQCVSGMDCDHTEACSDHAGRIAAKIREGS